MIIIIMMIIMILFSEGKTLRHFYKHINTPKEVLFHNVAFQRNGKHDLG